MASSTTTGDHLLQSPASVTFPPPPPPTPSNNTNNDTTFSNLLLNQLTPNLTLSHLPPTIFLRRRKSPLPSSTPPPPTISLLHSQPQQLLTTAATDHGFFHLTDHNIPSYLATSAHSEAHSLLLQRSSHSNHSCLGFDDEEDDDENEDFLVVDVGLESDLPPSTVREFGREMGRLGVEVVETMFEGLGLKSPFKDGMVKPRLLLWISSSPVPKESCGGGGEAEDRREGKRYPYVVCLQYEMKWCSRIGLVSGYGDDSDEVALVTRPDSVLITVGDIAQVWSNGRFKKVRGSGIPRFSDSDETGNITMSLMVTLPMESVISPLPRVENNSNSGSQEGDEDDIKFCSFAFEPYAWRLYHEKLSFKDPLLRYRL